MPSDKNASLCQAIHEQAQRLGFELFGVTTPDPPEHFEVYSAWLSAGRHGAMGYLATETSLARRADPRQILPGCRSIIVLGARHASAKVPARKDSNAGTSRITGKIASYAWGSDYHDVLAARLQTLAQFITDETGITTQRWYTDTGPLLERDLAQRAGLGWIGKNTSLINPQAGSYFFLAEILTELELPISSPFAADRCGRCTRCQQACPTACILPDRTIDARRCIAYLTIELKGSMPVELRPSLGEWVFGCDICQQVCPWNIHFAGNTGSIPEFSPQSGVPYPDLLQELALDARQFSQKYKGSPVKRARRAGYIRNVAVALGNSGAVEAIPALEQTLSNDPEPLARAHAAWALGEIGSAAALRGLAIATPRETDETVLHEIQAAEIRARQAA